MDYKRNLWNLSRNESYEEIDIVGFGWYVDAVNGNKKKKYKTKEVFLKYQYKEHLPQLKKD